MLYAKIKSEFDTVVDKCQVRIVVGDEENAKLRKEANEVFNVRDERLKTMTDESVPVFYSCIMCQAFSPSHVCIVTPERLGLCGAVSWLDAKATNELDPQGPCQVVTKERCIDERTGRYEDVDEAVAEYSHGALEHVTLYSLLEDPMTSCGCFECICGIEPCSMGVVITSREYPGMTPLGMTFSEMASMTGGGVQTPGFMGHGKHYIASKKFLKAEGGVVRLVWLPKDLKEQIREKLNETAKELFDVDNFADMVADETTCPNGDPEELMTFLSEVGHRFWVSSPWICNSMENRLLRQPVFFVGAAFASPWCPRGGGMRSIPEGIRTCDNPSVSLRLPSPLHRGAFFSFHKTFHSFHRVIHRLCGKISRDSLQWQYSL